MSLEMDRLVKMFVDAIRKTEKKTQPLDTTAEVRRIEGDTAWVHFYGGVDETPVKLTIASQKGDIVNVRSSKGKAWITGNATRPPTDDTRANYAYIAANTANGIAKLAKELAEDANRDANELAIRMAQTVIEINQDIDNLQDQVDGNITTWFYAVDPTLSNVPASEWVDEGTEDVHLGDLYYNTESGYAWRWQKTNNTYSWGRITDTDVTKALADAKAAQDTADSKRRVFYSTPVVPYDLGDLWVQGANGDILRCSTAKTKDESYSQTDWILASKYTDDTLALQLQTRVANAESNLTTVEGNITNLQGRVTTAESDITTAEGNISALQTRVSGAEENVDATLRELAVAQDVVGTINWITNHGTMTSTAGQTFDSNQVYFVVDPNGDYLVGGTRYAVVPEPVASDINNYYVLSISESVQNYVATHIAVDSEGLWIIPDSGGNKVLIATGSGRTYATAGTYIVGSSGTLASFTATGAQIGQTSGAHSVIDANGQRFYASDGSTLLAKFTTSGVYLGEDDAVAISPTGATKTIWEDESIGNFSFPATIDLSASAVYSILPDAQTFYFWFSVNGSEYHMPFTKGEAHTYENFFYVEYDGESNITVASYTTSQTEGDFFIHAQIEKQGGVFSFGHRGVSDDVGFFSATFGEGLLASGDEQAVFGRYNESDSTKAVIIGNGTATSDSINRSNALTVDWKGGIQMYLDSTDDADLTQAISDLGWTSAVIV